MMDVIGDIVRILVLKANPFRVVLKDRRKVAHGQGPESFVGLLNTPRPRYPYLGLVGKAVQ